jgi:hypothetical protein
MPGQVQNVATGGMEDSLRVALSQAGVGFFTEIGKPQPDPVALARFSSMLNQVQQVVGMARAKAQAPTMLDQLGVGTGGENPPIRRVDPMTHRPFGKPPGQAPAMP